MLTGMPATLDTRRYGLYFQRRALGRAIRTLAPVGDLARDRARSTPRRRTLFLAGCTWPRRARSLAHKKRGIPALRRLALISTREVRFWRGKLRTRRPNSEKTIRKTSPPPTRVMEGLFLRLGRVRNGVDRLLPRTL